jgi:hypothetical protein
MSLIHCFSAATDSSVWVWGFCYDRRPSGSYDQILFTVSQLRVCWCGALSLTRGLVCRLQLLLVLANAVILRSESGGTPNHILLSQIQDFRFVVSYDWYSTPPNQGNNSKPVWRRGRISTVTLRVVGGNEKGSLKSETVNYGRES